jgi:hypothetical protein
MPRNDFTEKSLRVYRICTLVRSPLATPPRSSRGPTKGTRGVEVQYYPLAYRDSDHLDR